MDGASKRPKFPACLMEHSDVSVMEKALGMKVCQLCAVDFTLDKFLLPLIDRMTAEGWSVVSVCSYGPAIERLRVQGYEIETVEIARSFNLISHLRSTFLLWKLFRRHRFDVVHVHTPVASLVGRIAAKLAGVPLVIYTAHGFYFHEGMPYWKQRIFIALEQLAGKLTDLLFTQSKEDADAAVQHGMLDAEYVTAIGNGVSPTHFDLARIADPETIRFSLGIPKDAVVIGIVARLVREKGVCEFLEAMIRLHQRYPNLWVLVIGERLRSDHADDVNVEIEHAAQTLGKRLILAGARSDIPQMMAAMDVFCLPSWREGMPRTIIEAMMMAKPVIATDIRGSREEVLAEVTGLLVPTRDPSALASAFERCLSDLEWANQLGRAGRERALNFYDEQHVVGLQIAKINEWIKVHKAQRICICLTSPFAFNAFLQAHVEYLASFAKVVVCLNTNESGLKIKVPRGVEIVDIPIMREISPLHDLFALLKMWHFLRKRRFDLVFSITPKGGAVGMGAAYLAQVPSRIHCFTGQVWATRKGVSRKILRFVDQMIARCATRLLADSGSQKEYLQNEGVVTAGKIDILGQGSIAGVDLEVFHPNSEMRRKVRNELEIADDEICLIFTGRLTEDKGLEELIDAYRRLCGIGKRVRLLLVGPDESGYASLSQTEPRIDCVGYSDSVADFMAAADILCLPSHREGFGSVLIEAGAVGLPVVASRIYGITDAVIDGKTGLLHRPKDIDDLFEKLVY